MPARQQTKQEDKQQSPEHEICHQPEPFHSRLDDRRTYKDPARTTSHPMKLCDPCQRVAPIDNGCRARPELMHEGTPDPYNAIGKPCEQCRHDSEEYGALHKKQFLSTAGRFQYSDAPKLMLMPMHCTRWRLVAE